MAGGADATRDFFDEYACCKLKRARRDALERLSRVLLDLLEPDDVAERSALEIGCGLGGLSIELAHRGASRVTGVDLSPVSLDEARRRAEAAGLEATTAFVAGDGATAALDPHDLVILDKVICCYDDPAALIANTAAAADRVYAFALPISEGALATVSRVGFALENFWHALRGRTFRARVHPIGPIDAALRDAGLEPAALRRDLNWEARVYRRAA